MIDSTGSWFFLRCNSGRYSCKSTRCLVIMEFLGCIDRSLSKYDPQPRIRFNSSTKPHARNISTAEYWCDFVYTATV
jgi:hypothetical protein